MERQKKYHILYKTTCTVTGNFYIGVHSTKNLEDGYLGSGKRLSNSIQKHGRENHFREILEFFDTREKAFEREKEIVDEIFLTNEKCMNLNRGGDGGWSSEMQKRNGKKANEKMKFLRENDEEWKRKKSESSSRGLKASYQKGTRKIKTPDWKGKKHKEQTKKKIGEKNSLSQKGEKNSQFGMQWIHSNELKKNSRISKNDPIPVGWVKGRKMNFLKDSGM